MDNYVIKNPNLKDYLSMLNFSFRQVADRTHVQKYIWLFTNTKELMQAITLYTNLKSLNREM